MTSTVPFYVSFLKKIGLAFCIYSFCRFIFYLSNVHLFQGSFPLSSFFFGFRFDYVAISYLFLPFIILSILPLPFKVKTYYKFITKLFFHLGNICGIILNFIDIAYYPFALKRSTADIFQFLSTGNDLVNMLPRYLLDYWYLLFLLLLMIVGTEYIYRKFDTYKTLTFFSLKVFLLQASLFIVIGFITVIGFRGGVQFKPIDIINAANHVSTKNANIVLNTPFCIIKTILNDHITEVNFFTSNELNDLYNPEQQIEGEGKFKSKNVVLIILESFAKEYVGFLNKGEGFTPFLDSLMSESYVFTNAYSSGTRSIESLPSIFAGIPPLMNTPFIISNYSGNKLDALPHILKQQGYNTSFYHGGNNGTMGFSGFSASAGIENYFGKDEYNEFIKGNESDWGIYDEPYLQYFAKQLTQKKEPFFSTLFTLSSHHPYKLPNKYAAKFPEGPLPIHKTINYTDYSIKQFFEKAKKSTWFNNTLFVFTSDHSSETIQPYYSTLIGRNAIPIFIYDPTGNLKGIDSNYFQHVDITPTVIDLLGIKTSIVSFGNSIFAKQPKHAVGYTSNSYYFAEDDYLLLFNGEKSTAFYQLSKDSLQQHNLLNDSNNAEIIKEFEIKMKAILQQYNNRLIHNKTAKNTPK